MRGLPFTLVWANLHKSTHGLRDQDVLSLDIIVASGLHEQFSKMFWEISATMKRKCCSFQYIVAFSDSRLVA